jgi:RNA polymerase sigma-70 factor, ECF subfamily
MAISTGGLPAPRRDDDRRLVAQIAAGSETALAVLYDRYAATIFTAAHGIGHDRGVAEEVVQETFLALWNRADVFDPSRGSLVSWLFAIARNRALDHVRWTTRRVPAAPFSLVVGDRPDQAATMEWLAASGDVIGSGTPDLAPDAAAVATEERESVVAALHVLTESERTAILLAYRDGLSQSEIATRLGWPLGTVKTRSRRALQRLREALEMPSAGPCCAGAQSA